MQLLENARALPIFANCFRYVRTTSCWWTSWTGCPGRASESTGGVSRRRRLRSWTASPWWPSAPFPALPPFSTSSGRRGVAHTCGTRIRVQWLRHYKVSAARLVNFQFFFLFCNYLHIFPFSFRFYYKFWYFFFCSSFILIALFLFFLFLFPTLQSLNLSVYWSAPHAPHESQYLSEVRSLISIAAVPVLYIINNVP